MQGYTCLQQNVFYSRVVNGVKYSGEVDLIGKHPSGYYMFCEIKSCSRKYDKATEQFTRFVKSHPDMYVKGVMISKKGVRRLYANLS